jgi:prepilin peptidase CpaA
MHPILTVGSVICVSLAAVIDVATRRVPNWLTIPGLCMGVCINGYLSGVEGVKSSLLGVGAGFLLLFFAYLLGGMGAGDVKLLSAVGSFLGPRLVFYSFVWMALAGGVLAVFVLLYKKAFSQTFRNLKSLLWGWILRTHEDGVDISLKNPSLLKLPYGVAIAIGTILAIFIQRIPGLGIQDGNLRLFFWSW